MQEEPGTHGEDEAVHRVEQALEFVLGGVEPENKQGGQIRWRRDPQPAHNTLHVDHRT